MVPTGILLPRSRRGKHVAVRTPPLLRRLHGYLARRLYTDETLVLLLWSPAESDGTSAATIVRAGGDELAALDGFDSAHQRRVLTGYLAAGDRAYLGYLDGRCVHRIFATPGPATIHLHAFLPRRLTADEVFIHSGRTARDARGRRIAPHALSFLVADLGPQRSYLTAINARNAPALRAATRCGLIETERVRLRVLGGLRLIWRGGPGEVPASGPAISRVHLRPGGHTRERG